MLCIADKAEPFSQLSFMSYVTCKVPMFWGYMVIYGLQSEVDMKIYHFVGRY